MEIDWGAWVFHFVKFGLLFPLNSVCFRNDLRLCSFFSLLRLLYTLEHKISYLEKLLSIRQNAVAVSHLWFALSSHKITRKNNPFLVGLHHFRCKLVKLKHFVEFLWRYIFIAYSIISGYFLQSYDVHCFAAWVDSACLLEQSFIQRLFLSGHAVF